MTADKPTDPVAPSPSEPLRAALDEIEQIVGSYDHLGTGSYPTDVLAQMERDTESAWEIVKRAALQASPPTAQPESPDQEGEPDAPVSENPTVDPSLHSQPRPEQPEPSTEGRELRLAEVADSRAVELLRELADEVGRETISGNKRVHMGAWLRARNFLDSLKESGAVPASGEGAVQERPGWKDGKPVPTRPDPGLKGSTP